MQITYESHKPATIEIIPFNDGFKVTAKFKLNCGLIVTQGTAKVDSLDPNFIVKLLNSECFFEVRRCNSGVMASAIYIDEDGTRQYVRGASPLEIMHLGFKIGTSPNGND